MRRLSQKGRAVHWAALRHVELRRVLKEKGDAVLRAYRSWLHCRWDACCMPQAVHQAAGVSADAPSASTRSNYYLPRRR